MSNKVLVETSARHVHLTNEHIEVLFGKGATLTHKKDLRGSVRLSGESDPRRSQEKH